MVNVFSCPKRMDNFQKPGKNNNWLFIDLNQHHHHPKSSINNPGPMLGTF